MTAIVNESVQRIAGDERIASLDVIRGIAILFILCMNIPWMMGYAPMVQDPRIPSWTGWDQGAFAFVWTFLDGTQRGLLELLFGAGVMIMARKAMTADGPVAVADLHYRRNLLLIALGLFNALILLWPGDILLPYGLAAIFLFPARLLKPRTQLLLGVAVLLAVPTALSVRDYGARVSLQDKAAETVVAQKGGKPLDAAAKKNLAEWQKMEKRSAPIAANPEKQKMVAEIHQRRTGPLSTYVQGQWEDWAFIFGEPKIFFSIMAEIVATMLFGMALFQLGIMQGRASARTYALMALGGYGIGLSLRYWGFLEVTQFSPAPKYFWLHGDLSRLAVVLGHVGAIHLSLRTVAGRTALKLFVAAGRMPLTTYLFTSLLMCWLLVPGIGVGLHGRYGWAGMQLIALAVIAAEVIATNIWMRYYETGPMEWLWKSLAYGRRQPYRRVAPAPALVAAE